LEVFDSEKRLSGGRGKGGNVQRSNLQRSNERPSLLCSFETATDGVDFPHPVHAGKETGMDTLIPPRSKTSRQAVCVISVLAAAALVAAENPTPTPAPRPGTLAAYASRVTLNRSRAGDGVDRLMITNNNLEVFAAGGAVTLGSVSTHSSAPATQPDAAERARWRKAYHKQRGVIAGLERRRNLLEVEIDHIEDGQLTAKNLARLDHAEAKARVLDGEIRRERGELSRIVREARRHGAEPGWFR
jgi:hypothetical protein